MKRTRIRWLGPQEWRRAVESPCLSLGDPGDFDDTHIHAPCIAVEGGTYWMWYTGSQGKTKPEKVYYMGLATSTDGLRFTKHPTSPVFGFGDDWHSVMTPTLLRNPDGSVLREDGRLRMWFSAKAFSVDPPEVTLRETASEDGLSWTPPSEAQLVGVYSPVVIKAGDTYELWYRDVEMHARPLRHATSRDGRTWDVTAEPVLQVDQQWEAEDLFYPTVLKSDGLYLMWYGSYYAPRETQRTALGFAVSGDGIHWEKSPHNPVFRPDPSREWESHYTACQSVMRLPNGSWRIWYASRTWPPLQHKYFAIGTAVWEGERPMDENPRRMIIDA